MEKNSDNSSEQVRSKASAFQNEKTETVFATAYIKPPALSFESSNPIQEEESVVQEKTNSETVKSEPITTSEVNDTTSVQNQQKEEKKETKEENAEFLGPELVFANIAPEPPNDEGNNDAGTSAGEGSGGNGDENPIQNKTSNDSISGSTGSNKIPQDVLGKMESTMKADFSDVKINTNSTKAKDAKALAFAKGNTIDFAPGQFNPNSKSGQELLGHELTHVVQQREGRVKPTKTVNGTAVNDDPGLEKEADVLGAKAASSEVPTQFKKEHSELTSILNETIQKTDPTITSGSTIIQQPSTTYNVSGTYREVKNDFAQPGEEGSISTNISSIQVRDTHRGRHLRLDLVVTIAKSMPNWTDLPEIQRLADNEEEIHRTYYQRIITVWTNFMASLDAHEEAHKAIDLRHHRNVHRRFRGKKEDEIDAEVILIASQSDELNEAFHESPSSAIMRLPPIQRPAERKRPSARTPADNVQYKDAETIQKEDEPVNITDPDAEISGPVYIGTSKIQSYEFLGLFYKTCHETLTTAKGEILSDGITPGPAVNGVIRKGKENEALYGGGGDEKITNGMADDAKAYYKTFVINKNYCEMQKVAKSRSNLKKLVAESHAKKSKLSAMQSSAKDGLRAMYKKEDEDGIAKYADLIANIIDSGLAIQELSKETISQIKSLTNWANTANASGVMPSADTKISKLVGVLNKINYAYAVLSTVQASINIINPGGVSQAQKANSKLSSAVSLFGAVGTLVGASATASLYANLHLGPMTEACMSKVSALQELISKNTNRKAIERRDYDNVNWSLEPGGRAMFEFMLATMKASGPASIPRPIPSIVAKHLVNNRDLLDKGTKSKNNEKLPTKGMIFKDLDENNAANYVYHNRNNLWAMFYGDCQVPQLKIGDALESNGDVAQNKLEIPSSVNVHQNSSEATSMGALAFAQGDDIHFAPGQFKPETTQGQQLIGHELKHVQQQKSGKVMPTNLQNGQAINDDPALEKEADDFGKTFAQHKQAPDVPALPMQLSKAMQLSTKGGSESEIRKKIVALAKGEIGKVKSKIDDGAGNKTGYERLLEYFHTAAPGVWKDEAIKSIKHQGPSMPASGSDNETTKEASNPNKGHQFPHWCGIFAIWATKKAGKDVGNWVPGRGVLDAGVLGSTTSPQPGDIGFINLPKQHHSVIKEVNGDSIVSIDGNMEFGEVREVTRPYKKFTGFFTAFGGDSIQMKKECSPLQMDKDKESKKSTKEVLQEAFESYTGTDKSKCDQLASFIAHRTIALRGSGGSVASVRDSSLKIAADKDAMNYLHEIGYWSDLTRRKKKVAEALYASWNKETDKDSGERTEGYKDTTRTEKVKVKELLTEIMAVTRTSSYNEDEDKRVAAKSLASLVKKAMKKNDGYAWSASTVSYIHWKAGMGDTFEYAESHVGYASEAKENERENEGFQKMTKAFGDDNPVVAVGDILVRARAQKKDDEGNRPASASYSNLRGNTHGDVVMSIDAFGDEGTGSGTKTVRKKVKGSRKKKKVKVATGRKKIGTYEEIYKKFQSEKVAAKPTATDVQDSKGKDPFEIYLKENKLNLYAVVIGGNTSNFDMGKGKVTESGTVGKNFIPLTYDKKLKKDTGRNNKRYKSSDAYFGVIKSNFTAPKKEESTSTVPIQKKEGSGESDAQVSAQPTHDILQKMEDSFGTSFSDVSIHQNSIQAKEAGALAFAQGSDVHFAPGQFKPETHVGQELIGHELGHIVQQREGRVKPTKQYKGISVNDDPGLELEADQMGKKAANGIAQKKPFQLPINQPKASTQFKIIQKADEVDIDLAETKAEEIYDALNWSNEDDKVLSAMKGHNKGMRDAIQNAFRKEHNESLQEYLYDQMSDTVGIVSDNLVKATALLYSTNYHEPHTDLALCIIPLQTRDTQLWSILTKTKIAQKKEIQKYYDQTFWRLNEGSLKKDLIDDLSGQDEEKALALIHRELTPADKLYFATVGELGGTSSGDAIKVLKGVWKKGFGELEKLDSDWNKYVKNENSWSDVTWYDESWQYALDSDMGWEGENWELVNSYITGYESWKKGGGKKMEDKDLEMVKLEVAFKRMNAASTGGHFGAGTSEEELKDAVKEIAEIHKKRIERASDPASPEHSSLTAYKEQYKNDQKSVSKVIDNEFDTDTSDFIDSHLLLKGSRSLADELYLADKNSDLEKCSNIVIKAWQSGKLSELNKEAYIPKNDANGSEVRPAFHPYLCGAVSGDSKHQQKINALLNGGPSQGGRGANLIIYEFELDADEDGLKRIYKILTGGGINASLRNETIQSYTKKAIKNKQEDYMQSFLDHINKKTGKNNTYYDFLDLLKPSDKIDDLYDRAKGRKAASETGVANFILNDIIDDVNELTGEDTKSAVDESLETLAYLKECQKKSGASSQELDAMYAMTGAKNINELGKIKYEEFKVRLEELRSLKKMIAEAVATIAELVLEAIVTVITGGAGAAALIGSIAAAVAGMLIREALLGDEYKLQSKENLTKLAVTIGSFGFNKIGGSLIDDIIDPSKLKQLSKAQVFMKEMATDAYGQINTKILETGLSGKMPSEGDIKAGIFAFIGSSLSAGQAAKVKLKLKQNPKLLEAIKNRVQASMVQNSMSSVSEELGNIVKDGKNVTGLNIGVRLGQAGGKGILKGLISGAAEATGDDRASKKKSESDKSAPKEEEKGNKVQDEALQDAEQTLDKKVDKKAPEGEEVDKLIVIDHKDGLKHKEEIEEYVFQPGDAMMPAPMRDDTETEKNRYRTDAHNLYMNTVQGHKTDSASDREKSKLREVGMYRNSVTGEVVILQGNKNSVPARGEKGYEGLSGSSVQDWQALLDGDADVGKWKLVRHSHPANAETGLTPSHGMFPSGYGGDFGIIWHESLGADGKLNTTNSRIDVFTDDGVKTVSFGFNPYDKNPFWIRLPHEVDGHPKLMRFKELQDYHDWYKEHYKGDMGVVPNGSSSASSPAAPPSSSLTKLHPSQTEHLRDDSSSVPGSKNNPLQVSGSFTRTKQLQSAGNAGSISSPMPSKHPDGTVKKAVGTGVFRQNVVLADGTVVSAAIKVYPKDGGNYEAKLREDVVGASIAEGTGMGPKVFGYVDIGEDDKVAFAMEVVKGHFLDDFSLDSHSPAEKARNKAESEAAAKNINATTYSDLETYGQRILGLGYYYSGELQGLIDDDGRYNPIDFTAISKLPPESDTEARKEALIRHKENFEFEKNALKHASSTVQKKSKEPFQLKAEPSSTKVKKEELEPFKI